MRACSVDVAICRRMPMIPLAYALRSVPVNIVYLNVKFEQYYFYCLERK